MVQKRKLTPAEWEIMEAVWNLDRPVSIREVLDHLYPAGQKAYTTVQTVMNTLEKKSLLNRRKTGLVNFYAPTCSRGDTLKNEMSALVKRVFGGSIPAVASSLMELDDLGLDEVEEIKALIVRKERELKEGGS